MLTNDYAITDTWSGGPFAWPSPANDLNVILQTGTVLLKEGLVIVKNEGFQDHTDVNRDIEFGANVILQPYGLDLSYKGRAPGLTSYNTSTISLSRYRIDLRSEDTIAITATNQVYVISPLTIFGTDNSYSELRVNRINNYLDSGFVLFPGGIQFGNQTYQTTAFRGYDQGTL
jgi:hypothetical protein